MTAGTATGVAGRPPAVDLPPQEYRTLPAGTALRRRRAREIALRTALLRRVRQP